jgi:hypothetical protein
MHYMVYKYVLIWLKQSQFENAWTRLFSRTFNTYNRLK